MSNNKEICSLFNSFQLNLKILPNCKHNINIHKCNNIRKWFFFKKRKKISGKILTFKNDVSYHWWIRYLLIKFLIDNLKTSVFFFWEKNQEQVWYHLKSVMKEFKLSRCIFQRWLSSTIPHLYSPKSCINSNRPFGWKPWNCWQLFSRFGH